MENKHKTYFQTSNPSINFRYIVFTLKRIWIISKLGVVRKCFISFSYTIIDQQKKCKTYMQVESKNYIMPVYTIYPRELNLICERQFYRHIMSECVTIYDCVNNEQPPSSFSHYIGIFPCHMSYDWYSCMLHWNYEIKINKRTNFSQ